jgi:hypothetical protein
VILSQLGSLMNMRAYRPVFLIMVAMTVGVMTGCATPANRTLVAYQVIDHPPEERIELRFHNDTERTACLTASMWPDDAGNLNQMGQRIALMVDGQRYPVVRYNKGFCVLVQLACVAAVPPGAEVKASIPYAEFALPATLKYQPKTVDFSPTAPKCH